MNFYKKGQSLVEILVIFGLLTVLLPAVLTGVMASRDGKAQEKQRSQAISILREAEEATRSFRQKGWVGFAVNGTYHNEISGSSWTLVSGPATASGFTKQVVISDFLRDGTIDPPTKVVTTTVSWTEPRPGEVSTVMYLTRYRDNTSYEETSYATFNTGTKTQTAIAYTNGSPTDGHVQLGAGGGSDWCSPSLGITQLDLPKSGVANAVSAIAGQSFAGTGDNASGVSFANILISQPASGPPSASISGTFDGYKTNAVFGEAAYAYLGTDSNSKEIVLIDLNNKSGDKFLESGYFNAPGNGNGDTVFVLGTTGYMTSGTKLYKFDLTSKSGSRSQIGSAVTLAAAAKKLIIVDNYAYVALNSSTTQMQIINLDTGSVVAWVSMDGIGAGRDIYVKGDKTAAYLATGYIAGKNDVFVFNLANPPVGNLTPAKNYSTNGMDPRGITVVTNNKAIIVGHGGYEYQVIDLNSMASCALLDVDAGINGVASVLDAQSRAYSYIITGDASTEFKMIEGGPGGTSAVSGTFESQTFDPCDPQFGFNLCYNVSFNRFFATTLEPSGTDISFKIAVSEPVNNSCSGVTFDFVDLSPTGSIWANTGRCFRYKATFSTSDPNTSPYLYDATVNFSP